MKILISNFFSVLKHFRSSSIINILGLSAALVVFFIVLMQVYYDFGYDKGYKNSEKIVQFNNYNANEGTAHTNINFQIPALIKERVPEIEAYCMLSSWGMQEFDIEPENEIKESYKLNYIRSTPKFLTVFSPEIILGDTTALFSSPGKAMISEKTAQQLFGDENPIGKVIDFHYHTSPMTVQAVYRDFPDNSFLDNGLYTYLREYDEEEWSFKAFFLVKPENLLFANQKLNTTEVLGEETVKYLEEHPEISMEYRLTSPNELYLYSSGMGGSKRITTTVSLFVIGILTILIAFINFVNLSLAMTPSRIRGINVRKILGVNRAKLRLTIAMESVLFTIIALLIAFLVIYFIKTTALAQEMFATDLSLWSHVGLLSIASLFVLTIAFLIGFYTSQYSTSFDESEALKGSFAMGVKGTGLRNVLIVIQFSTAIALICISTFIKRQHDFMLNYDWGIPKENIVYLPLSGLGESSQAFGQELLRDPRVKDYSIVRDLPGRVGMTWGREFEGKQINLYVWSVDDRFFDFFEVDILSGRKPEHMDSVVSQIVLNQTFLEKYEFDESLVGKDFPAFGPGRVQAIAKDINFHSLHEDIQAMAFGVLSQWNNFSYFLVKLTGNDIRGSLDYVEQTWNKFTKERFEAHFLDESMDKLYQKENNMSKLIALFGFIIVIIAVMGVYGLILFNTKYKAKEIAIRKVNGSTEKEIIFLLNRSVLIQLGIAFIISVPTAYFVVRKWLEGFAYKIDISWWVFALAGVIVLIITLITVSGQTYKSARTNPTDALSKE